MQKEKTDSNQGVKEEEELGKKEIQASKMCEKDETQKSKVTQLKQISD